MHELHGYLQYITVPSAVYYKQNGLKWLDITVAQQQWHDLTAKAGLCNHSNIIIVLISSSININNICQNIKSRA